MAVLGNAQRHSSAALRPQYPAIFVMKHNIFNPAQVLLIAALLAAYTVSATTTTTTTTTTYYWTTTTREYNYANLTVTPNVTYAGTPINITVYGINTVGGVTSLSAYYQNAWHRSACNCTADCTRTWTVTENTPGNYTYKGAMNCPDNVTCPSGMFYSASWPNNITVRVLPTSTTTSTTTSSTTSTTMPCAVPGDYPPCATVTLAEVVDYIILWSAGQANLGSVIDLINAWVMSG